MKSWYLTFPTKELDYRISNSLFQHTILLPQKFIVRATTLRWLLAATSYIQGAIIYRLFAII